MEELAMKGLSRKYSPLSRARKIALHANWMFEIEPDPRSRESLISLRDELRMKKLLKRAIAREVAPVRLVEAIRAGIRA